VAGHLDALGIRRSFNLEETYNSRTKRDTLGACSDGVRGILDIGTDDELARRGEDACTHAELGVRAWMG